MRQAGSEAAAAKENPTKPAKKGKKKKDEEA